MTSNQRRPGFRLPWSSGEEEPPEGQTDGAPVWPDEASPAVGGQAREGQPELEAPVAASRAPADAETQAPAPAEHATLQAATSPRAPSAPVTPARRAVTAEAAPPPAEPSAGFMRDLVAAMRRVAEETRQASLADLRAKSEQQVQRLESDSERQREDLKARAEADIAGVGVWARAEEERIRKEAEQRVVGRRAQLDQQLAAEASRAQAEAQALRERLAAYEAELDAYHAQLSDIADPAAFAAVAKRMPPPPLLAPDREPAAMPAAAAGRATPVPAAPEAPAPEARAPEAPSAPAQGHPDEGEVPAQVDATRDTPWPEQAAPSEPPASETEATDVLVKGLGSFGAITGFRQALASVEGVDGVSLSLGPTGEFVFRAIHGPGFDMAAAIIDLEGDAATIDERSEGRVRVTLQRTR